MSTVTDEEAKKNIAANLQRLLEKSNVSRRQLAVATGESHTIISQYARGVKLAGSGSLSRIAEFFGIKTDDLLSPPPGRPRRKKSA